jgi:hypothetical protein
LKELREEIESNVPVISSKKSGLQPPESNDDNEFNSENKYEAGDPVDFAETTKSDNTDHLIPQLPKLENQDDFNQLQTHE